MKTELKAFDFRNPYDCDRCWNVQDLCVLHRKMEEKKLRKQGVGYPVNLDPKPPKKELDSVLIPHSDKELKALNDAVNALLKVDQKSRQRVIAYLDLRFGNE